MMRGAIFDMDGTLLDSMGIWMSAGAEYISSLGATPRPGLGEIVYPMTVPESALYLKNEYAIDKSTDEIVAGIYAIVEDFYKNRVKLKPNAAEFLRMLKTRGFGLALATVTGKDCAKSALLRTGVLGLFNEFVDADEVGCGKEKPDIYLRAAERLGTRPAETFVFEDALHAATTAKKAGFVTVGVYDESGRGVEKEMRRLCSFYLRDFSDFESFAEKALK